MARSVFICPSGIRVGNGSVCPGCKADRVRLPVCIAGWFTFLATGSIVASFLPALWLLFSISFARANYSEQISRWKWVLVLSFALPLFLAAFFGNTFFTGRPVLTAASVLFIRIGWSGYLWHLLWIVAAVLILMNLERTFRHATGHMRWQTKFLFLGSGGFLEFVCLPTVRPSSITWASGSSGSGRHRKSMTRQSENTLMTSTATPITLGINTSNHNAS